MKNLEFSNLGLCVDCIKEKQTKHNKKAATRSSQLLEIIYTDACGFFDTSSISGEKYFIIFIDDFSHYGYVYLLKEKPQAFDTFKIYINGVEK